GHTACYAHSLHDALPIFNTSFLMKKHNFGAGPGILPDIVFEKAAAATLNFNNSGLSILEISHRSKDFVAVMENAQNLVLDLTNRSEEHTSELQSRENLVC